jgi:predicted dienelactone hydrolase
MQALQSAASVQSFKDRVDDVRRTIDQLEKWTSASDGPLAGRLDTKRLGMSGHSFGAVTTQAVSGQRQPIGGSMADKRIKAAVIMSPNGPRNGFMTAERAFADVRIPWMLMTGTKDDSPIGDTTPQSRLVIFPALPPGDKFELVLKDGQHWAFTERSEGMGKAERNPQHWNTILALSTAFWDSYLRDDAAAKAWLMGKNAEAVLSPGDRWQKK